MSRRIQSKLYPKVAKDMTRRKLRFFCTGEGAHGAVPLAEYWAAANPDRPDREAAVTGDSAYEDGPDGRPVVVLPSCHRCPVPARIVLDWGAVQRAVQDGTPGVALRWDVSLGKVLHS